MSDDAGGRPTPPDPSAPDQARRPLRLPELDPLPWTGTAAPGNTGRPYGQAAILAAPPGPGRRPDSTAPAGPATDRGGRGDHSDHGDQSSRGGHHDDDDRTTGFDRSGSAGGSASPGDPQRDRVAAVSADRAGRRALRTGLAGVVLFLLAVAFETGAPGLAGIAGLVAFAAGVAAFVRGIGAVRQARRARVSGVRGGLAVTIGAIALVVVIAGLGYLVANRSAFSRYVSCVQSSSGSAAAVRQQCSRELPDVIQQGMNR